MWSVRAVRLDSLGLDRVDLLKIDVEGMELDVLRGAQNLLARCRPVIVIEHLKSDLESLRQTLTDLGYLIYNPVIDSPNLFAVHATDRIRERVVRTAPTP